MSLTLLVNAWVFVTLTNTERHTLLYRSLNYNKVDFCHPGVKYI